MYAPTVWRRRLGTFFDHDGQTDPTSFGSNRDSQSGTPRAVSRHDLEKLFANVASMSRRDLIKKMVAAKLCSEQTADRATNLGLANGKNYVLEWLSVMPNGFLEFKA